MRTSYIRDDLGNMTGETKQVDTPGLSFSCDLLNIDGEHSGPCASPSDPYSVAMRQKWQREEDARLAAKRHSDSGLNRVQSQPMTVASIVEGDSLMPHPSAATSCPFCAEKPLFKELSVHVAQHAMESERRESQRISLEMAQTVERQSVSLPDFIRAQDSTEDSLSPLQVVQEWVDGISGVVFVPKEVKQALAALGQ